MSTYLAVFRAAAVEAWSKRASFWTQIVLMVLNDLVWVVFWIALFGRVDTLRGWTLNDVLLLFALTTTVAGVGVGLLANCRHIGRLIADGELDAVLTLPVRPLVYMLARRLEPFFLGDAIFGMGLFLFGGHPTPERALLFAFGTLAGAIVLVSFLVLLGSLTFFIGGRGEPAEFGFLASITLTSYPLDLFGGLTKLVLFTVVPAGFITGVPASLVRDFDLPLALGLLGVAAAFALAAGTVFTAGLRRYSSGSVWTRA